MRWIPSVDRAPTVACAIIGVALVLSLLGFAAFDMWRVPLAHAAPGPTSASSETGTGTATVVAITSGCVRAAASGGITVTKATSGGMITLGLFGHIPASSTFTYLGDSTTVPVPAGDSIDDYSIPITVDTSPFNTLRVQILSTSFARLNGMTTAGPSFSCAGPAVTSASPTPTPRSTPTSPPAPTPTPGSTTTWESIPAPTSTSGSTSGSPGLPTTGHPPGGNPPPADTSTGVSMVAGAALLMILALAGIALTCRRRI